MSGKEKPKYKRKIYESVMSRVYVDYSGKKPKISFSVPKIKKQRENFKSHGIYWIIMAACYISLFSVVISWATLNVSISGKSADLTGCNISYFNQTAASNAVTFEMTLQCLDSNNATYNSNFTYSHSENKILGYDFVWNKMANKNDRLINGKSLPIELAIFCASFFLTLIILFPFRAKIGSRMMRGDGENVKPASTITFMPKDVFRKNGKGKWVCELPGFHNHYIDYNPSGDFQKYLLKVNIIDLPVYCLRKARRKDKKSKKAKHVDIDGRKYINIGKSINHWKAEFIFKEKPLKGEMVCNFD